MQTFVALMRGINVGSTRKVPMAELRALCAKAGLKRPETYIQSGNLIVDTEGTADKLRRLLEKAMTGRFGFAVDVVVRAAAEWERYVEANPYAGDAGALPKMVHLYLSRDPIEPGAARSLRDKALSSERISLAGGALWIDYGASGVGRSKLTPTLIDKACGSPTTGRNWNSVLRIHELIAARGQTSG
jgi:uncharacterized protein (DUF1697 family)